MKLDPHSKETLGEMVQKEPTLRMRLVEEEEERMRVGKMESPAQEETAETEFPCGGISVDS